jgi:hypothetical protein
MRTAAVIIMPPGLDDRPGFRQVDKHVLVQALVSKPTVEAYMDPARAQGCKPMNGRIRLQSYIRP